MSGSRLSDSAKMSDLATRQLGDSGLTQPLEGRALLAITHDIAAAIMQHRCVAAAAAT